MASWLWNPRVSLWSLWVLLLLRVRAANTEECPDFFAYSQTAHRPLSNGTHRLGYQRPSPKCRTFHSPVVEDVLGNMSTVIRDPDLYRLFQNTWPNTLDTAIRWKGVAANNTDEELTFIITGDINAMWLRDSANQMQSYLPVLRADPGPDSLASLYRGVINLQARYLLTSPFCNSFQAPDESGLPPAYNEWAAHDRVTPPYNESRVFECKYELDSLAAFLQISTNYYDATADLAFFGRFQWVAAVQAVLNTATAMMAPTAGPDDLPLEPPYRFTRPTSRVTETLSHDGVGSPVANGTGLIRSGFRPSDDATVFQLLIPANMMFSRFLTSTAAIAARLSTAPPGLAARMRDLGASLGAAITAHGVVRDAVAGRPVFAYEVDGRGGAVVMDDANVPSLLAAPLIGLVGRDDEVYRNTRAAVLGGADTAGNPYYMRGRNLSAVGSPHTGGAYAWPMASVVRVLTSNDDVEIAGEVRQLLGSTDGLGLMHEGVAASNPSDWTRPW